MDEVTEQVPDFTPDPDDDGPLFPEGSQGEKAGSLPGSEGEHGGEDGTPLPPEPAAEPEKAPNPLAGKRLVFAAPSAAGPWQPLCHPPGEEEGATPAPILFDGDDREARLEALDKIKPLAERVKNEPGSVFLSTTPAASWKPRAAGPRPRKSDWTV